MSDANYKKYKVEKKQISYDGETWYDVYPLTKRKGNITGEYTTLEECGCYKISMSKDGVSSSTECDLTSTLTSLDVCAVDGDFIINDYKKNKTVVIGNCISNIGKDAFCSNNQFQFSRPEITGITFLNPDNIKCMDDYSFAFLSGLSSITIPSGVTNIGNFAFKGCSKLSSITIEATEPPRLGNNAFEGTSENLIIDVPNESVDKYKSAPGWNNYANKIQ